MPANRKPVKAALVWSYAGSITVGFLLAGALESFVLAVSDPIDLVVAKVLNFFLLQARTFQVRILEPRLSGAVITVLLALSGVLFGCGLWLGTWLYPTTKPAAHVATESKD